MNPLTQPDPRRDISHSRKLTASDIAGILFPIMMLMAFTSFLAAIAALLDWYDQHMHVITAVSVSVMLLIAICITYLYVRVREERNLELHNAQARLGSIVETAMDAVIAVDESQQIVLFNKAAERVFGRSRQETIGKKLAILLPERFRGTHDHHVRHFGETGITNRRMGDQTVLCGLRANGEEFPIEASISQQGAPGHKIFTVILRDATTRVRNEQALRRSREELRELSAVSQSALEQEKSRVARELHDEIGGSLTALKMDTAWVAERLPAGESAIAEKLAAMQKMLDHTVAATRRISSDLRPMMLDDLGLVPAAEWLVHDFQRRTGIVCELAIATAEIDLPSERATTVYRILQESLTNIAKHARATHAEVTLETESDTLILTVRDNGAGFDAAGPRAPRSFGLVGMRERVHLLGGEVRIESSPGKGTTVDARIPMAMTTPVANATPTGTTTAGATLEPT